tara:strand:- start:887 stop:1144 length:258 start_codon:yes stop_codon:yes gene_type:complete
MTLIGSNMQIPEWSEALRMEPREIYDEAIIGYDPQADRLIYNEDKVIDILITKEEMSTADAIEYYDYNIVGSQGENYPIYIIPAR